MTVNARFQEIANFSSAEKVHFPRGVAIRKQKQHKTANPQGKINISTM